MCIRDRVGAEAFHGKGAGDADFLLVLIGFVVEELVIGLGGDGGVDLLLPGDALLPPLFMQLFGFRGPALVCFARDLPFLPVLLQHLVELAAERFELLLEALQEKLEPLRGELNKVLKKNWEEWQIPREADESWPAEAKKLHEQWWEQRIARQQEIDASIAAKADHEFL